MKEHNIKTSEFYIKVMVDQNGFGKLETDLDKDTFKGITSLVLAHACEGIDISSVPYVKGVSEAVQHLLLDLN